MSNAKVDLPRPIRYSAPPPTKCPQVSRFPPQIRHRFTTDLLVFSPAETVFGSGQHEHGKRGFPDLARSVSVNLILHQDRCSRDFSGGVECLDRSVFSLATAGHPVRCYVNMLFPQTCHKIGNLLLLRSRGVRSVG